MTDVSPPQATELFLRAVQEEQKGAVYVGTYEGCVVIRMTRERVRDVRCITIRNNYSGTNENGTMNSQTNSNLWKMLGRSYLDNTCSYNRQISS